MKKLYWVLVLVGVGTACQHQAPPTRVVAVVPSPAVALTLKATPSGPARIAAADTLTTPMRNLLQTYDLAMLWRGQEPDSREPVTAMDGFFGPDHYRISFVFTWAQRDSADPAIVHVSGKTRYKKQVLPFTGLFKIQTLADLDRRYPDLASDDSLTRGYTATAHFSLQEDPSKPNAGKFDGTGILDCYIGPKGEVGYAQIMGGEDGPARGQGLLLKGSWTGANGGLRKDLLLARSVFSIAPDVLKNFAIGERDATINPKYAKLGWDKYWENDEWWADSPTPRLNM